MLTCADNGQLSLAVDRTPDLGDLEELSTGQICTGQGLGVGQQILVATAVHHTPTVLAGIRSDVDDPVGRADGVFVVFHDDEGVAQVAQPGEGVDESTVVALVKADRWFVEHVEHAGQTGADLGGQADTLRLAAGERSGSPRQRQVLEPDVEQECDAGLHLFEHTSGNGLLARAQLEVGQVVGALGDRQRTHVRDRLLTETLVVEGDGEDLGAQAGTTALGARDVTHVTLVPVLHLLGLGLFHAPVQERHHTFELGVVRARTAIPVAKTDVHLMVTAVQDRLTRLERELLPRRLGVESHLVAEA